MQIATAATDRIATTLGVSTNCPAVSRYDEIRTAETVNVGTVTTPVRIDDNASLRFTTAR